MHCGTTSPRVPHARLQLQAGPVAVPPGDRSCLSSRLILTRVLYNASFILISRSNLCFQFPQMQNTRGCRPSRPTPSCSCCTCPLCSSSSPSWSCSAPRSMPTIRYKVKSRHDSFHVDTFISCTIHYVRLPRLRPTTRVARSTTRRTSPPRSLCGRTSSSPSSPSRGERDWFPHREAHRRKTIFLQSKSDGKSCRK